METKKENKILKIDTIAVASDKVQVIKGKEKPADESNFVENNTISKVQLHDSTDSRS